MAKFKVRRDAVFTGAACFIDGAVDIDDGVNTASGSVSTFSGGLTAASAFLVSGCAKLGAAGANLAGILAGSTTLTLASYTSGCTVTIGLAVTGLTQAHKVFMSASEINAYITLGSISCSPGGGVITVGVTNNSCATTACAAYRVDYLAILDK